MFKPHRLYACRGDPVELISIRGEVAIVKNTGGERFSVRIEFLNKSCEEPHNISEKRNKISDSPPAVSNIDEKPKRKIIRKTGRTNDSLSLF